MQSAVHIEAPVRGVKPLPDVAVRLHGDDDVAIARVALGKGLVLVTPDGEIRLAAMIPAGHKVALRDLATGAPVRRYGQVIGFARASIQTGDHVHSHNLGVGLLEHDYAFAQDVHFPVQLPPGAERTFAGYRREDGRVGTRNYLAVISSVNCSASVSRYVADRFRGALNEYPHVDGVIALTHKSGCGAHYGRGIDLLQRVLAGFATHPNVSGYILIGLGCEMNQISDLVERHSLGAPLSLVIQDEGGLLETVEAGVAAVAELLPRAEQCRRSEAAASELMVALQCGGSDAWSGVTANPALGHAVDLLVAQGGTAVLGETPEIYGAEHLLTRRAVSEAVGRKLVESIRWWEEYTAMHGAEIDNNPTPGNKLGGLTTIYEKSLGAVAKSGTSPLVDVVEYAEQVRAHGFVHMDTPGYDPVSVTGQVAGGCNLVAFTTGRGSVFGCRPAPSIKVASNSVTYERMRGDMDVNAGRVLEGSTVAAVGEEIFELMLEVASGHQTLSEGHGIGDEDQSLILGATL